jgi:large subunit ribosomal protein L35
MAYKFKPRKSIAKRFRVTGTGKLKHERTLRRHLLSGRSGDKKRAMSRPQIMSEGHAKNFRLAMGLSNLNPTKLAHVRRQKAAQAAAAAE